MDDKIRELRRAGWSERRIAAELGVTRHRVRSTLAGFRVPAPAGGLSWSDEVELHISHARSRQGDEEQIELGVLAFDVAERLDGDGGEGWPATQLAVSLSHIVAGVSTAATPLTRIHARLARRMLDVK